MTIDPQHVAVVGATGPTGRHLIAELRRRGVRARAVSRSAANLAACFPEADVERAAADALDREALAAAVAGCDLVVDCIGLPPERMDDHEATAAAIAAAAAAGRARCLQVSSFWSFLPARRLPLDEDHPREGGNRYARARRAAEDAMLAAGAAVVHLPDFYGPLVHTGTLQRALEDALAGGPVNWPGSAATEREYVYVPDAMAVVADLAAHEEAYGRSWLVPGAGPLSARGIAESAGSHRGREVAVRTAPSWLLKVVGLFSRDLRAFRPILEDYMQPIAYDGGRLEALLGPPRTTPYAAGIAATLDWLAEGA